MEETAYRFDRTISSAVVAAAATVRVLVINAREDLAILREVKRLLSPA